MTLLRNITLSLALAGVSALGAAHDLPVKTVNGKEYYYYEVPSKATIYSLTRKLGYTRDEIIKYNPQVRDGLRAGDTLFFPVEKKAEEKIAETPAEPEARPEVKPEVKPVVPEKAEEPVAETEEEVEGEDEVIAPAEEDGERRIGAFDATDYGDEPAVPAEPDEDESVNVGVMLPFMLEAENATRQSENNCNFYRGMLLAVNDLSDAMQMPVNLYVYDTEGSADVVGRIMADKSLPHFDYIIAPGDSLGIEHIAVTADSLDATVVNLFAVKNDAFTRHESILQANIPSELMYSRAIAGFCDKYAGRKVIVLNPTDIHADKSEFTDELTATLVKKGIPYEKIDFDGRLEPEDLGDLPAGNYVFVPTGASREVLVRVLPALTAYREAMPAQEMTLFGYPEWVTHRGEIKENLHKLGATIYSRFSTNLDSDGVRAVQSEYTNWYGTQMPQAVPNSVLLGYDTMAWIISAALNGLTEPYEGLQNTFKVIENEGSGDVNTALYFLNFRENGALEPVVL